MAETDQEKNPVKADSADESEDEGEVLEESPCGRWQKRREEVCHCQTLKQHASCHSQNNHSCLVSTVVVFVLF